jgi:hypothetical protein
MDEVRLSEHPLIFLLTSVFQGRVGVETWPSI